MNKVLDPDTIAKLLERGTEPDGGYTHEYLRAKYPIPPQEGPLRYYDRTTPCASKGCRSPSHYKVQGVTYCTPHALKKLNHMLIDLGVTQ